MIRYRRLYESKDSNIRLYDVVECGGHYWIVIDLDGDIATLLAKKDDFGSLMFDFTSNDYNTSLIRDRLQTKVLNELKTNGADPIPTRLPDVQGADKIWILSIDEVENLPKKIREFPSWWRLRTPGEYSYITASVNPNGKVFPNKYGVSDQRVHLRPAMRVKIEDLLQ